MNTPLIICADDFGYADAVDAGIARLVELGRVTASSCLTSSPRWPQAVVLARSLRTRADLGLHLDLTEFARIAALPRLLLAGRLGLLDRRRVQAQVVEQLTRFEDCIGAAPDYVDGHQHVHQLPAVAEVLVDELRARYSGRLPWIRVSRPTGTDLKSRIIKATGARGFAAALNRAGFRHTHRLLGVYDFRAAPPYLAHLTGWLNEARSGDALMVHPAATLVPGDPLAGARQREFAVLESAAAQMLLTQSGVVPARGNCLTASAAT